MEVREADIDVSLDVNALAILLIIGNIGSTACEVLAHHLGHVLQNDPIVMQSHHNGDRLLAASLCLVDLDIGISSGRNAHLLLFLLRLNLI